MPAESETYEEKSEYGASLEERLKLVKSIVAMANTQGGEIHIQRAAASARQLDSASLDTVVNSYVGPAIGGIESTTQPAGGVHIRVPESTQKPHVITRYAGYEDGQGHLTAVFHPGQVWVRHGSANAEATPQDVALLIQTAAGRLLEELGARIQRPDFDYRPGDQQATPVRLDAGADAVPVRVDTSVAYPHTRRSLAEEIGHSVGWVAAATEALDIESDVQYAYSDRNAVGHATLWRYSDEARARLLAKLEAVPDWDPRHEHEQGRPDPTPL